MPNTYICKPRVKYFKKFKKLKEIVEAYIDDFKENVDYEIEEIKKFDFNIILKKVGYGRFLDDKKLYHLLRLKNDDLLNAKKKLLHLYKDLNACKNFHEIFKLIQNEIESEIYGIGEMYTYDIAFYIGIKLGFKPKYVYLHKGTRLGAKALGMDVNSTYIPKDKFPKEFQNLETYDIENLLCIYKDEIKYLLNN